MSEVVKKKHGIASRYERAMAGVSSAEVSGFEARRFLQCSHPPTA